MDNHDISQLIQQGRYKYVGSVKNFEGRVSSDDNSELNMFKQNVFS